MPSASLQLHGTLDDFLDLVRLWAEEGLIVSAKRHSSDWFLVRPDDGLAALRESRPGTTRIVVADEVVTSQDDEEVGRFVIEVGNRTDEGLRESAMGIVVDDPDALEPWRSLIRQVRSGAHRGASVVNPETGARDHLPSHIHLQGAHDLAATGVRMLAAAGWNFYEFDDLSWALLVQSTRSSERPD